ncbi:hypothetical protein ACFWP2_01085 [Kitasatospora sp. NPDC058444]|uniref:hypothetical protein n=1 Tax=Kitasatospora sp. NPDC058444 TaxID=3346504 RepID=UPI00365890EF
MTDQQNSAPAVWDPTARGGAGGWVRGPQRPADPQPAPGAPAAPASAAVPPPSATEQSAARPGPMAPPPAPGAVGDQGPPLGARPYLAGSPGYDPPTARLFPGATPPPPAAPPTAPFPSHAGAQAPGHDYVLQPPAAPPTAQPPYDVQAPHDAQAPYGAAQPAYGAQPPYGVQPPYGAQPDYPTGHGDEEDRPANRKAPLLIGFALLLVLAIGGGLLFATQGGDKDGQAAPAPASAPATGADNPPPAPAPTGTDGAPSAAASASGSPTGAPSPTATAAGPGAQTQAQALDSLLSEGENAKAPIGSAVAKVTSCPSKADIESAAQTFDNGASQRTALLAKLSQLSVTDVPGGADAVNSLKSAWQLSADIDKAYASWARAVAAQGCTGRAPATQDKKHADELNPQATQAKTDFMNKWNPIAKNYGLTPRTQDRI